MVQKLRRELVAKGWSVPEVYRMKEGDCWCWVVVAVGTSRSGGRVVIQGQASKLRDAKLDFEQKAVRECVTPVPDW
jgi:hypothetical protein